MSISGRNKRKRTANTSKEQCEIYIQEMEKDYYLRSGTINPTLEDNYLTKKWEELSRKLNSVGEGPSLSPEEWKKRFSDWKYATRGKYRKFMNNLKKTGGGPASDITITDLEDRALSVWGRAAVTGAQNVPIYDGLPLDIICINNENTPIPSSITVSDISIPSSPNIQTTATIPNINVSESEPEIILDKPLSTVSSSVSYIPKPSTTTTPVSKPEVCIIEPSAVDANEKQSHRNEPGTSARRYRPKPLSILSEKLIENNQIHNSNSTELNNIIGSFAENYIRIKKEKLEFEKTKLKFEICKLQLQHPNFNFEF